MSEVHKVSLGDIQFGDPQKFTLIAGPCVIESEELAMRHAEKISEIAARVGVPYIFKASFDKANRSSVDSYRGPGLEEGLKVLAKIKSELGLPVLSDVHEVCQVKPAAEVLDVFQIPAFLCRQTDLLVAAAETGKIVNVKKGQFLSPWEMKNVVSKLESTGTKNILLTDRGTSFGYKNLVSDFRSIPIMREFGYPIVFDATHSVQMPGGQGTSSGGAPEFIPVLSRCAIVAGADAVFMEVHEDPSKALSDGPNNLRLDQLQALLENLLELKAVVAKQEVVGA